MLERSAAQVQVDRRDDAMHVLHRDYETRGTALLKETGAQAAARPGAADRTAAVGGVALDAKASAADHTAAIANGSPGGAVYRVPKALYARMRSPILACDPS
jgi:hypothetical protein